MLLSECCLFFVVYEVCCYPSVAYSLLFMKYVVIRVLLILCCLCSMLLSECCLFFVVYAVCCYPSVVYSLLFMQYVVI